MKLTEIRCMGAENVQRLCIEHGWYKSGSNEDFEALLAKCKSFNEESSKRQSKRQIELTFEMATDIFNHSGENLDGWGITEIDYILYIMCEIVNECVSLSYHFE